MGDTISPEESARIVNQLIGALRNSAVAFDDYGKQLSDEERQAKKAQREKDAADEKFKQQVEKSAQTWASFGNKLNSLGRSMATPEGAMSAMGDLMGKALTLVTSAFASVPVVGGMIKGLGEAGAETIKFLMDQTAAALKTYNQISSTGVIGSFQDMRAASEKTGLTFEQLNNVISKNSQELALFGGSAIEGSKMAQRVLAANKEYAVQVQKAGVNFEEFSSMQLNYINQQTKLGFARGKSDDLLAEEARKYSEELIAVSKLTGKSREDLQKEQNTLLSDARYRAKTQEMLASDQKEEVNRFNSLMQNMRKESHEGLKDIFAGANQTDAARRMILAMQAGGVNMEEMIEKVKNGSMSQAEFVDTYNRASKNYVEATADQAKVIGPGSDLTANYVHHADQAALVGKSLAEQRAMIDKDRAAQLKQEDAYASAANKAQELAVSMGLLATNTESLAWLTSKMADAIKWLLKKIMGEDDESDYSKREGSAGVVVTNVGPGAGPESAAIAYRSHGRRHAAKSKPTETSPQAAANGALIQPTPGGTLLQVAESGAPEAVVPLPDGRTIPVVFKGGGEQSKIVVEMLDQVSLKLETVVSLMTQNARYNRDIAQNVAQ